MKPTFCECETCKEMKKEIKNPKCIYCNEHHDPRVHCIAEIEQKTKDNLFRDHYSPKKTKKKGVKKPSTVLLNQISEYYVELADGKYTVYQPVGGSVQALRYGEHWRDLFGDNLVFYLMVELIEAKEKMEKALKVLNSFGAPPETAIKILKGEK